MDRLKMCYMSYRKWHFSWPGLFTRGISRDKTREIESDSDYSDSLEEIPTVPVGMAQTRHDSNYFTISAIYRYFVFHQHQQVSTCLSNPASISGRTDQQGWHYQVRQGLWLWFMWTGMAQKRENMKGPSVTMIWMICYFATSKAKIRMFFRTAQLLRVLSGICTYLAYCSSNYKQLSFRRGFYQDFYTTSKIWCQ